uniref:Uncharacterized protein n=1 Tax=Oryza sativa subsp. japonica TaxID=39947 RepID=Q67TN5_ORYSJ|nr:hypothetical protein [Oryza sativa Japonica Group]BAD38486.1 hypothetical protein [Oryza sativa Japonica Group]
MKHKAAHEMADGSSTSDMLLLMVCASRVVQVQPQCCSRSHSMSSNKFELDLSFFLFDFDSRYTITI